jgi:CheY-like chemotaxis protein
MDGYTATSRIKSDPKLRSIPIIAVTSYGLAAKKRRRGLRAAMTACRNLSARATCCQKFVITCNKSLHTA